MNMVEPRALAPFPGHASGLPRGAVSTASAPREERSGVLWFSSAPRDGWGSPMGGAESRQEAALRPVHRLSPPRRRRVGLPSLSFLSVSVSLRIVGQRPRVWMHTWITWGASHSASPSPIPEPGRSSLGRTRSKET